MNKTTAQTIVLEVNPNATPAVVENLLEASKGVNPDTSLVVYRPYYVAARTLYLNPPNANLKKADSVEWFDWTNRINGFLSTQASLDCGLEIPCGHSVGEFSLDDVIPLVAFSTFGV